jgi:hypothetical protein
MSAAEVMTAALTAAAFFSGSHEKACRFLKEYGYIPDMLSKSRFSRRLAAVPESVCRNIRIKRCRIYQDERFRGYSARFRQYFYGIKVHVLMTETGILAEIIISH